jgi:ferritin-like metal-binding protein YciE
MAKGNGKGAAKNTKSSGAGKSAATSAKATGAGKSSKAQRDGASTKHVESAKLVEYIGQAAGKERHIEAALASHLVMTTRPAYHGRLEEHLRATKVRAEKLEGRVKELGGSTRSIPAVGSAVMGEVKDAAKMVADRAVSLAKGPLDAMRDDHEAETLLEHARVEYSDACEQIGTYTVVGALAKAADDKKTGKLAKDFRGEHADMAEFIEKLIPKLSNAVVKTEVRGQKRSSSDGTGGSASSSGSGQGRNGGGAQRSRSGTTASSRTRSSTAKAGTSKASAPGSRSKSGAGSRGGGSSGSGQRRTAARSS